MSVVNLLPKLVSDLFKKRFFVINSSIIFVSMFFDNKISIIFLRVYLVAIQILFIVCYCVYLKFGNTRFYEVFYPVVEYMHSKVHFIVAGVVIFNKLFIYLTNAQHQLLFTMLLIVGMDLFINCHIFKSIVDFARKYGLEITSNTISLFYLMITLVFCLLSSVNICLPVASNRWILK